jgi:uncharacterized coiled-coil protein SlyX
MKTNASINERTRTLFIAINIADDYFKTIDNLEKLKTEHKKFITEMGRMQEENILLTEKLRDFQDRLNAARYESGIQEEDAEEPQNVVSIKRRIAGGRK